RRPSTKYQSSRTRSARRCGRVVRRSHPGQHFEGKSLKSHLGGLTSADGTAPVPPRSVPSSNSIPETRAQVSPQPIQFASVATNAPSQVSNRSRPIRGSIGTRKERAAVNQIVGKFAGKKSLSAS